MTPHEFLFRPARLPLGLMFALLFGFAAPLLAQEESEPGPTAEEILKDEPVEKKVDYFELMRTIVDTFEQIERNYVDDVDTQDLANAAVRGMLSELDPYSSYISPDQVERFDQSVEQEFGGIGIQVSVDPKTKRLTVLTPLPGTPAYKAGIRAGDVIETIEGESTEGFNLDMAIKKLKGAVGDPVNIGVRHLGATEVDEVTVVRDIIQVSTVLGDRYKNDGSWNFMLDEERKLGYIRLTHFSRRSDDELFEALEQLKAAGMKGLILDLRNNPGGLLTQAISICDMFCESGRIVSTKGRNSPERVWNAKQAGTYNGFPMAVLVNRFSASASEITSACLQDQKRAVVIGERTWGKGSVQNVIDLQGGESKLKLTTAAYYRPSGKNIHRGPKDTPKDEWGVMPNEGFRIRFSDEELQKYLDYRRQRDVLRNDGPEPSDYSDRQLAAAVKYLLDELESDDEAEDAPQPEVEEATEPEPAGAGAGASLPQFLLPKRFLTPSEIANRHGLLRLPRFATL